MAKKKSNQFDTDEMYRQLRTNIEFSNVDERVRVVNLISTIPDEGKSTIAMNLARVFADQYKRVLLIDCDLRSPCLHHLLNVSKGEGLSNFLASYTGKESIYESVNLQKIQTDTGHFFYFMSAGSRVPNPLEIVSSKSFAVFLQQARREFSFIVLDCPPISLCSDGIPLSNASDGTLYVVSGKDTDKRQAKSSMNDLTRSGANIIGLCLTKMTDLKNKNYYYYNYGYGETKGEKNEN